MLWGLGHSSVLIPDSLWWVEDEQDVAHSSDEDTSKVELASDRTDKRGRVEDAPQSHFKEAPTE